MSRMRLFFARGVEQIRQESLGVPLPRGQVVLLPQEDGDPRLASGGAQDRCLREALQGLRDREVRQGHETYIREGYDY